LLTSEVVVRFYEPFNARIEISPTGVVGAVDGVLEAGGELEADIYLAVLTGLVGRDIGAYGCGEVFAET
jgi:hypothetical protein